MTQKQLAINGLSEFLGEEHHSISQETDRFQEILTHLRYEGKACIGKNLKEVRETLKFFNSEVIQHMKFEEETLFPFLEVHIPKLESVIHLLHAEHEDFKRNLKSFELSIRELEKDASEPNDGKTLEKIRELGIYLIYLIRNHIQAENESVYKIINQELRPSEKQELKRRIKKAS
ncbi:MAG: hemerythrin domain-containing protein [Candidatus Omnitrophica bacterium]|nr:hemerythrin domain-containing protein [Candidatus Omnitrophota bacterium]